jgi:RimJ/RimL family protein N-acetyltransferase
LRSTGFRDYTRRWLNQADSEGWAVLGLKLANLLTASKAKAENAKADRRGDASWAPDSVSSVVDETWPWELRLSTDRLCLRVPAPRDADALYDLFADAEVMQGLGKKPFSAVEEVRAMIEDEMIGSWRTDGLGAFVLETTAAGQQVVGQAGLMIFDTRGWTPSTWANAGSHAQPELGWALMRAHWGHGYATEAAAAIRDWAQQHRKIDRLVSLISPDNVRSQRVAERLGAVPTETVTPADSKRTTVVWRHPPIV